MKKPLYLFIFILISLNSNSQNLQFELTTSPLSLIDPTHPNLRIGTEFIVFEHFSFGADFGYGTNFNYKLSSLLYYGRNYSKYDFFQIRPEIKYIFTVNKQQQHYIGLEYFYLEENNIIENSKYVFYEGQINFSKANYFRNKEGFHLKFGVKANFSHFIMDMYFGGGIMRKYAEYSNFENRVFQPISTSSFFYNNIYTGYTKATFHLTMGIKVGLRL